MARDDQGANDVAVLDDDGIDEDTPFNSEHHARERSKRNLTSQLKTNAITDAVERTLGVRPDEWFELEARYGLLEIRHHRDDLCTGNDLEEGFDDQTGLFACAVQIRVIKTSHGGSTFADG
jgi:hypothetical protein